MAAKIRFYLDENVPVAVATQLRRRGLDAVTVRDLGVLGDSDTNHLRRAAGMGRVREHGCRESLSVTGRGGEMVGEKSPDPTLTS